MRNPLCLSLQSCLPLLIALTISFGSIFQSNMSPFSPPRENGHLQAIVKGISPSATAGNAGTEPRLGPPDDHRDLLSLGSSSYSVRSNAQLEPDGGTNFVPEDGTIVGRLELPDTPGSPTRQALPDWATYDPVLSSTYYVSGWPLNNSLGAVIDATPTANASYIEVGADPVALAVDTLNGWVYVANYKSDFVSVLNGTEYVANVSIPSAYAESQGIAFDSADGCVYDLLWSSPSLVEICGTTLTATIFVSNRLSADSAIAFDSEDGDIAVVYDAQPNLVVTSINGTTVEGNVTYNGTFSSQIRIQAAFDSSRKLLYAGPVIAAGSVNTSHEVMVVINGTAINGTSIYGVANLTDAPVTFSEMAASTSNGLMYIPNDNGGFISVFNGTTTVEIISDPINSTANYSPSFAAYDPASASILVMDGGVAVIPTALWESPLSIEPIGNPFGSADVGNDTTFNTTLWSIGSGNENVTFTSMPSAGAFTCTVSTEISGNFLSASIDVQCLVSEAGNFSVMIAVYDGYSTVHSSVNLEVYPAVGVPTLSAEVGGVWGREAADVNETVNFNTGSVGYSNPIISFVWHGLGVENGSTCRVVSSAEMNCTFSQPGLLPIWVTETDGNGASATSTVLDFRIFPELFAGIPELNRSGVDVGQPVLVRGTPSGGSGEYSSLELLGANGAVCTPLGAVLRTCSFEQPGRYELSMVVVDSLGASALSPAANLTVSPLPGLAPIGATRVGLDVGQTVIFWANQTTGLPVAGYTWSNLPDPCEGTTTASPSCQPATSGWYNVSVLATDVNGGNSASDPTLPVYVSEALTVGLSSLTGVPHFVGSSVQLKAAASGGAGDYTYQWSSLPGGCESNSDLLSCVPSRTGSYSVKVTVVDGNGDSASALFSLTVSSRPMTAAWSLVLTVLGGTTILGVTVLLAVQRRKSARGDPKGRP